MGAWVLLLKFGRGFKGKGFDQGTLAELGRNIWCWSAERIEWEVFF